MFNDSTNFNFWCPIEKAKETSIDPNTGEVIMKLGGIASTIDEDSDGEFLDPKGFDIEPLLKSGMVNWHHQAKGQPATIIGEPVFAEIRPDGLYVETVLYPSLPIAKDVWTLAETLEKYSPTRRLGYSIEGKVIKRKSNDKNSPDYKRVEKAIITGMAITHQPKNCKTFANIIKGNIDDDFSEEEDEKGLNTDNASALKKESIDKKNKKVLSKAEGVDKILKDITGIDITKAEKIFLLSQKIANMKGRKKVTDEDIEKAYQSLGLEIDEEDIKKGCSTDPAAKSEDLEKSKEKEDEEEETNETEEEEEKEEDEDDEDEEEEDEEEEKGKKGIKKGGESPFDRIEKAISASHLINSKYIKALGVLIKDASQKLEAAAARETELLDLVKAQDDTISEMSERIERFGSSVPAPKSISSAKAVERVFEKSEENEIEKAEKSKRVSMSKQKNVVAEILDQATFAKGYDSEFSKAVTAFEANGTLPQSIISRIKTDFGIEIVK